MKFHDEASDVLIGSGAVAIEYLIYGGDQPDGGKDEKNQAEVGKWNRRVVLLSPTTKNLMPPSAMLWSCSSIFLQPAHSRRDNEGPETLRSGM
jgi:hypothetical protein